METKKEYKKFLCHVKSENSKYGIQKYLKDNISMIEKINQKKQIILTITDDKPHTITTQKRKENNKFLFDFEIQKDLSNQHGKLFDMSYSDNNLLFIAKDSMITTSGYDEQTFLPKYQIQCNNIIYGEKSTFYRMILPIEKSLNLVMAFYHWNQYSCDTYSSCSGLLKFFVNGDTFHIFQYNDKYLIIDSTSQLDYQKFYDICVTALVSLGIITGYFVQKECYIISSDKEDFKSIKYIEYKSLRESKKSNYRVLPLSPYDYFNPEEAEQKRSYIIPVHSSKLTKLINSMLNSEVLLNALFILVESFDYPLDTHPACLSVVLEGICNYIENGNLELFTPINEKSQAKKLKKAMKDILKNYSDYFSKDGEKILIKRIDNINSETNSGRFKKCIDILGIKLTDYEEETLINRNTFLHGDVELKDECMLLKAHSSDFFKFFFAEQILLRLLYKMILKIMDYDGYMVNFPKYQNEFENLKNEDLLIRI